MAGASALGVVPDKKAAAKPPFFSTLTDLPSFAPVGAGYDGGGLTGG
jgi:hypothetical protein